jgi:hypothetical protein
VDSGILEPRHQLPAVAINLTGSDVDSTDASPNIKKKQKRSQKNTPTTSQETNDTVQPKTASSKETEDETDETYWKREAKTRPKNKVNYFSQSSSFSIPLGAFFLFALPFVLSLIVFF